MIVWVYFLHTFFWIRKINYLNNWQIRLRYYPNYSIWKTWNINKVKMVCQSYVAHQSRSKDANIIWVQFFKLLLKFTTCNRFNL